MQHINNKEEDVFTDIIKKIHSLTFSQQKFIQELLFREEKVTTISNKTLLKKSFGVWSGRKDIRDSIKYVDEIRKGWESHFERIVD